jgi:pyruvate/2-oxoacid:ferredoxin oxidoreductase beta subunit
MFGQKEKDLGIVAKKDEIDVQGSMLFFANMFKYVQRTLGVEHLRLFRKEEVAGRLKLVSTEPPGILAGEDMFKERPKKDLGMIAMAYNNVYVAHVAFGAKDAQTVKAFVEADAYDGPSLIIAYAHCIAHGYELANGLEQQKLAVESGYWPLYRFDPRRLAAGENPLQLDSATPKGDVGRFMANETRFRVVQQQNPERYKTLLAHEQQEVLTRFTIYEQLAKLNYGSKPTE